jgi:hypothetical protein
MGPARGRRTHQSARPCAASEAASRCGCCAGPSSQTTGRQRTSARLRRTRRARAARRFACAACAAWRSGMRACTTARTSSASAPLQPVPCLPALAVHAAQVLGVQLARYLHAFCALLARVLRATCTRCARHLYARQATCLSAPAACPGLALHEQGLPPHSHHRGGDLSPVLFNEPPLERDARASSGPLRHGRRNDHHRTDN